MTYDPGTQVCEHGVDAFAPCYVCAAVVSPEPRGGALAEGIHAAARRLARESLDAREAFIRAWLNATGLKVEDVEMFEDRRFDEGGVKTRWWLAPREPKAAPPAPTAPVHIPTEESAIEAFGEGSTALEAWRWGRDHGMVPVPAPSPARVFLVIRQDQDDGRERVFAVCATLKAASGAAQAHMSDPREGGSPWWPETDTRCWRSENGFWRIFIRETAVLS